ncbi:unnamed protein product [Caenorhabditis bovis]|uniref:Uncharacterized protein n=1 Tax=Caenorhabditis bovis TaxID=2654633 RepID=A0A8S1F882_9PELO|nr:unnamed protein product [Caenorhabditis bovis]
MADEHLAKAGLYVDDFNRLRLIDPEIAEVIQGGNEKAKDFNELLKSFGSNTKSLIESVEQFARLVETEKIRAMTTRGANDASTISAHDPVILQMTIREYTVERDRLRAELEAVKSIEREQQEFIAKLMEQ